MWGEEEEEDARHDRPTGTDRRAAHLRTNPIDQRTKRCTELVLRGGSSISADGE